MGTQTMSQPFNRLWDTEWMAGLPVYVEERLWAKNRICIFAGCQSLPHGLNLREVPTIG
jgi:hypothetical protein